MGKFIERRQENDSEKVPIIATGRIYEDARQCFIDGTEVRTSRVLSVCDGLIHTQNSVYEIN
jgi:hypothetical protein